MNSTKTDPEPNHSSIEIDLEANQSMSETEDSDYGSGYDSDTASLSSSINEYVFENGRRYHSYFGTEKNLQPNDEVEQDRLDLHHEIFLMILNRELHKAPLFRPQRILDVGTGTGIWAIDAADKYPMAEVIGIDLSPIQPQWVPPNCRFEVDDAELQWTYRTDYFDFVHARNIAQSIASWPKLLSEFFRCTKPGGYAEIAELDSNILSNNGYMDTDNVCKRLWSVGCEAIAELGRPQPSLEDFKGFLTDAGFEEIEVYQFKQPFGSWPKDKMLKRVGAMTMLNAETALHAYAMAVLTRGAGMSHEEADKLCNEAINEMKDKGEVYNHFNVIVAKKPVLGNRSSVDSAM